MNQPAKSSPQQPGKKSDAVLPVNPNLSTALREDYDAVQDDLRQAREFALNLELQLAGKSKELLHLKFLLEQTKSHLGHLQDGIIAMRKERHKLANTALRAPVM